MKIDSIILLESERVEDLYPFSIMHTSYEVRCGCLRLFEKIQSQFPKTRIIYRGREKHLASFIARTETSEQTIKQENILIFNSRYLPSKKLFEIIVKKYSEFVKSGNHDKPVLFESKTQKIALYLAKETIKNPDEIQNYIKIFLNEKSDNIVSIEIPEQSEINYLWDTFDLVAEGIEDDFGYFKNHVDFDKLKKNSVYLINAEKILIGEASQIAPTVVLDAGEGAIVIGKNVKIMPHSFIMGPCFIGDNCLVKAGAKIYGKTSIGQWCKVGGEVENSIIHAYSNKQHQGFLGHSYLCEWVNLGADTNTSDLKNTYSEISVMLKDREVNTGRIFMGLLCGDHSKSGINSMFTTGTVTGICGILLGDGFMPRSIPSFSWGGKKDSPQYKISKALEVAKIVMDRRNKSLLPEEETLITEEYKNQTTK